jgi:uncharacterized membrane protein YphA (DoxX/SURF4 family)
MKKISIAMVILLLGIFAWERLHSGEISLVVNGHELAGSARLGSGWGVLVAIVSLCCAAIVLVFALAGLGLVVLGVLVLAGLATAWFAFPFLLPLLIPLFIVWLFVAAMRGNGRFRV